jgi:polyisoprenoid-binding protein YceI
MSVISPDAIPTGTYNIDPAHSDIGFAVRHMGISTVRGSFAKFTGTIDATGPVSLGGTVEVASIDTGDENRDAHLQSPDFFDAAQFPEISFTSTAVEAKGDGELKLTGDITIHGVTKSIELTGELADGGEDPWGNQRIGIEVTGKIDRREFGLTWSQSLAGGNLLVSNDVKLTLSVSAVKAS